VVAAQKEVPVAAEAPADPDGGGVARRVVLRKEERRHHRRRPTMHAS